MGRLNLKTLKLTVLRTLLNWFYQANYRARGPRKRHVTFVTMRSSKLTDNLKALHDQFIQDGSTHVDVLCYHYDRTTKSKLGFLWASLRALRLLASSELFIVDDYCFPLYAIHKHPENQVVQLWHAIGALKKFGLSLPNANQSVLKPHTNYDWVFINTPADKFAYVDAFDVDPAHVVATGEPMLDQLVKQKPVRHGGAKRLLYSPTHRAGAHGEAQVLRYVSALITASQRLKGDWEIYISLHPYLKLPALDLPENVHVFQDAAEVKRLMPSIDLFITDYSSLSLNFSYFKRPILLYTPDYQEYLQTCGFYVDYYDYLGIPYFKYAQQVVDFINRHLDHLDLTYVRELNAKTFPHQDGHNAQRVFQFLNQQL